MEKITSRKNALIRHFRELCADPEARKSSHEYVCDGIKMLEEAQHFGAEITSVICREHEKIPQVDCLEVYQVPDELFDYVSPLKNSPGPLFTVQVPEQNRTESIRNAVILDSVQDPGNVGTVIRTANALCIDAVILTGTCADLYHPRTVRATMGAIFRQSVFTICYEELKTFLNDNGLKLYGAALHSDAKEIQHLPLDRAAVAIGSEGHGLSKDVLGICDGLAVIPMNPESESLNAAVAASIFMWEIYRRNLQ